MHCARRAASDAVGITPGRGMRPPLGSAVDCAVGSVFDNAADNAVDFAACYALAPGVAVVRRNATTLQIGTDPPRRFLLADAPQCARKVLTALDGTAPLGEVVTAAGGLVEQWRPVFEELLIEGLLVPAAELELPAPHLHAERLSLIHRHGVSEANRILAARADAIVVVEGDGPLAETIADLLAGAGVGDVHHQRAVGASAAMPDGKRAAPRPELPRQYSRRSSQRGSQQCRQGCPLPRNSAVRPYPPAPQTHPTAVVFADTGIPNPGRAAELVLSLVPHLAAFASPAGIVIGPFVLPGRTACLNCVDRHRADADPDLSRAAEAAHSPARTAGHLATLTAAATAAEQVLDLIDGVHPPQTVGATVERPAGGFYPRRRPWPVHPDCRCTRVLRDP